MTLNHMTLKLINERSIHAKSDINRTKIQTKKRRRWIKTIPRKIGTGRIELKTLRGAHSKVPSQHYQTNQGGLSFQYQTRTKINCWWVFSIRGSDYKRVGCSSLNYHILWFHLLLLLKDEDVLSDLMLLENQKQILVLHNLSQILFPDEFDPTVQEQRATKINKILSVLFYFRFRFFRISKVPRFVISFIFFVNSMKKILRVLIIM